ncbi:hypothetical protein HGI30_19735 [Paenibacillus albicereus]|uniref:Uncharacterized protein n=1 Tax=Paenibacillus albicereus TaxID=2726185 RepID=A0A6H2H1M6_9BACL|nr:hypothetical protein [Paenibacillus albicereus]QJC53545.1 hypothetical protein HGI30_19735 [Paenibacillus albicereus]
MSRKHVNGKRKQAGRRCKGYYRHHRERVIRRKVRLARRLGWVEKHPGAFSKGKVHCSCRYCREKTGELGWKKSDRVNRARLEEER